jgi:hypothetical protein
MQAPAMKRQRPRSWASRAEVQPLHAGESKSRLAVQDSEGVGHEPLTLEQAAGQNHEEGLEQNSRVWEKAMARSSFLAQNLEVVCHSDATSDRGFKRSPLLLIESIQLAAQKSYNVLGMIRRLARSEKIKDLMPKIAPVTRAGKRSAKDPRAARLRSLWLESARAIRRLGLIKSRVTHWVNAGAMRTMQANVSIGKYCRTIADSATCGWQAEKFEQMTNTNIREA